MNARPQHFPVTDGGDDPGPHVAGAPSGRWLAAFLVILLVLLLASSAWVARVVGSTHAAARAAPVAAAPTAQEIEYFPPANVNQAAEPTAHLQAF